MSMKHSSLFSVFVLMLCSISATTAEKDLTGNWRFYFPRQSRDNALWLIRFEQKDAKWQANVVAARERFPKANLTAFQIKGEKVSFTLTIPTARYIITATIPKAGASTIYGSIDMDGSFIPIELAKTKLTSLNQAVLDREVLASSKDRIQILRAATRLIQEAENLTAKPAEVKVWVDQALTAAGSYGDGYKREILFELIEHLNKQDRMGEVALPLAQDAEKMVTKADLPEFQIKVWNLLRVAYSRAGKTKEAQAMDAKIKSVDYNVRVTPYPGRSAKSNRVVLVELFTGTECPPCIAADLAFDGLKKTYKTDQVVLLQYHLHIPGPDPLTNASTEARWKAYSEVFPDAIRGTPTLLVNGNPARLGGGGRQAAQARYQQYKQVINPLLEKASRANLQVTASRKGDKLSIEVNASEVKDAAESTLLHVAIVEDEVSYTGGNKIAKHHFVVRGFASDKEGVPVTEKAMKKSFTIDVNELKTSLKAYLDKFDKSARGPFPSDARPLDLKNLHVIAFLQDDNSSEVIQSAHAEVK